MAMSLLNKRKTILAQYVDEDKKPCCQCKDGEQGPPGADGPKGPKGDTGADGAQGKSGRDGLNGLDGKDGKDGADGVDGKDAETRIVCCSKTKDAEGNQFAELVIKCDDGEYIGLKFPCIEGANLVVKEVPASE